MEKKIINRRQFLKIFAVTGTAGVVITFGLDAQEKFVTVSETRMLMGTIINLTVVAKSKTDGRNAIDATFVELERQIGILNHRSPDSPAALLNRKGILANPPLELVEVLEMANSISDMTDGAFDVTVKPLIDLYQQTQPDLPNEKAIRSVLARVDYRKLSISPERMHFALPGMAITLDGIAKGYIVDAGVALLRKLGYDNVFVEAGGDLMAFGVKENGFPWKVGVQSPRNEQPGIFASFNVSNQAVATSGDYMQPYSPDMAHHHITDPRTGYSAPYIASSTVTAPSCVMADAFATALMVLEPNKGIELVNSLSDIEALLIAKNMKEFRSIGFQDR